MSVDDLVALELSDRVDRLESVCEALAALVRAEYPAYSLAHIADTWGRVEGVTSEQIEALRWYETAVTQMTDD